MAKILDTKSPRRAESTSASSPSLISEQKLIAIYTMMVRCRILEQRVGALFQQGKLQADLHASAGREACAVAVGVDLEPQDTLSIVSGDWLPVFVLGLPAETLLRILAPRMDGHSTPAEAEVKKRNILAAPDSADQPAIVQERAEALHASGEHAVVVAFLQPSQGHTSDWQKVLSAAAAKRLPILFVQHVLEDRLSPPSSGGRNKAPQALLHGVPTIAVDGADAVALYRVAHEAIARARQGRGATILQCAAVPVVASVDAATNQPVRPPDPVAIMETYLKSKGIQPEHHNHQVVSQFTRDLDLATRFLMV